MHLTRPSRFAIRHGDVCVSDISAVDCCASVHLPNATVLFWYPPVDNLPSCFGDRRKLLNCTTTITITTIIIIGNSRSSISGVTLCMALWTVGQALWPKRNQVETLALAPDTLPTKPDTQLIHSYIVKKYHTVSINNKTKKKCMLLSMVFDECIFIKSAKNICIGKT